MCEQPPGGPRRRAPGSVGAYITNWREYDAPALTKLRLAVRNSWLRVRRRSLCCGHGGEPGC